MNDLRDEHIPRLDQDPRQQMREEDLALASRNAFPVVAGDARRKDSAGLLIGASVALGLGLLTFTTLRTTPNPQPALPAAAPPAAQPAPVAGPAPDEQQGAPAQVAVPPPTPAQAAVLAQPPGQPAGFQLPAAAPVMVYDTSGSNTLTTGPAHVGAPTAPAGATPGVLSENEAFGSRVGSAGVETASASRLADPSNTVTQGTLIPAILETAIDSDLPGYVRAVVSVDVRSFDGKRVLVPRSSRLIGQYKSGLAAGQTRAYVIWTRLIRPDGVSVALASPAVESSGRSGLTGEVENHFFKRFGSASLLSVIGGLGALATGGAAGLIITANTQSAASVAAQRDVQIPPTIRVAQGQPVRVFTARDLDFAGVAP